MLVGVDEVGRGCLAGPLLVVAAYQIAALPSGVADSKTLNKRQREVLFRPLMKACVFGEGWVWPVEINRRGIAGAMRLGAMRAIKQLGVDQDQKIIMDGHINYLPTAYSNVHSIVRADAKLKIVAAASIYAKVRRDKYMIALSKRHPRYGFDMHVGYGTQFHIEALKKFGSLKLVHRQLFRPVYELNKLKT